MILYARTRFDAATNVDTKWMNPADRLRDILDAKPAREN
jgi:hypothetical protein